MSAASVVWDALQEGCDYTQDKRERHHCGRCGSEDHWAVWTVTVHGITAALCEACYPPLVQPLCLQDIDDAIAHLVGAPTPFPKVLMLPRDTYERLRDSLPVGARTSNYFAIQVHPYDPPAE